jgi:hypothetical protein
MGTVESDIGKYLGYMFSRFFGNWLAQNPQLQTYVWPILGVLLVGVLMLAAIQAGRNREVPQPEPASNNASTRHRTLSIGIELQHVCRNLLFYFREIGERLKIEAPKGLRIPLGISIASLLCGVVGEWPYDFFVLLRVVVFTTCIIALATIQKAERSNNWLGVLLATVVVYNPLLPIHLHKSTWSWLNCLAFIVLGVLYVSLKPTEPNSEYLP